MTVTEYFLGLNELWNEYRVNMSNNFQKVSWETWNITPELLEVDILNVFLWKKNQDFYQNLQVGNKSKFDLRVNFCPLIITLKIIP